MSCKNFLIHTLNWAEFFLKKQFELMLVWDN